MSLSRTRAGDGPKPSPARAGAPIDRLSADLVHVDEVESDPTAADGAHDSAQRAGGAAVAADHLAQVIGVHPDLEHASATQVARGDLHVVGVVDDALHQVLEGFLEHPQASVDAVDSEASAASSDFFSDFFAFGVIASPFGSSPTSLAAASNRARLSAFGSATFIGAGAGRPLNFCQSPVTFRMASTGSVGWAPTFSQCC